MDTFKPNYAIFIPNLIITMTKQAHFTYLPQVLAEAIRSAKKKIYIAVCLFTLPELFEALLMRQRKGIFIQCLKALKNVTAVNFSTQCFFKL